MEREIWDIVKALDEGKITVIEAHKKLCGLYSVTNRLFRFSGTQSGIKFIEEIEAINSETAIAIFEKELPYLKWTTITDVT